MPQIISSVTCLLLALCLFHPAMAEEPFWRKDARAEAERDGYALIDTDELVRTIGSGRHVVLLDVRADYEYREGHLPGAVNLEFDMGDERRLTDAKRQALLDALGPNTGQCVVTYCRGFR